MTWRATSASPSSTAEREADLQRQLDDLTAATDAAEADASSQLSASEADAAAAAAAAEAAAAEATVGRCRLTLSKPVFKAPTVSALETTMC
jgi:hypothetical protein